MDKKLNYWLNLIGQIACYNAVWLICISTASHDKVWLGFFYALGFLAIQFHLHWRANHKLRHLLVFTLSLSILGGFIDSLMFSLNVFIFKARLYDLTIVPPFLMAIWLSFSVMFYSILKSWFKKYALISCCSLIGFPLAYYFGSQLGAAAVGFGYLSYIILGIIWAVTLPLLLYSYNKLLPHDC